ncbi:MULTISPECIES: urease subunit beta [unclassified Streptomyces]|uniref:urease subunit beta n=1 Tax=unclassified Streptomyces TaxID=2593676 RepID=UPI0022575A9B|nr:urease subunit beta [Streptomyces sp. NBC_00047]MCX5613141.1 urease subunit beta [Streptomyces sp. NBC_00047]
MPYFQPLSTNPEPPLYAVSQPVPTPPGPGLRLEEPLPKPSSLDPGTVYAFSEYEVGGVWVRDPDANHELNSQGAKAVLYVINVGDRDIQIGSHIHLADVNEDLLFFTDKNAAAQAEEALTDRQLSRPEQIAEARRFAHDRSKTPGRAPWGFRLDVAPGDSKRFSPENAPSDKIEVVEMGGKRRVPGLRKDKPAGDVDLD